MKAFQPIVLGLLAASTLSLGALALYQYNELRSLNSALMGADPNSLQRQLTASRKTIRSLEDQLAAMRGRHSGRGESGNPSGSESDPSAPYGDFGGFANRRNRFAELSANPEFQKLLAVQNKGRVDQIYGALFKSLNLAPEQLQQFQSLLAEKQQAMMDVFQAAQQQGINPRTDPDAFKQLVNQTQAQVDASIQQTLGADAYAQYQQYQQTLPERNTVNSLQQALSYTQTPLTDDQASQMVQLLSQTQAQRGGSGTADTGGGNGDIGVRALLNGGGTAQVTDNTVAQAQGVLSGPQIQALQQVQQQQQAQRAIQQMMRQNNRPPAPAPVPGG